MFLRKEFKHYNNRIDDIDKVNEVVMDNDEMGILIERLTII